MRAKWLGVVWAVMLLAAGQAGAYYVDFNDGGYHVIDYVIDGWVYVDYDKPDAGTQIEVVSGGWITDTIDARGISKVTVNGGTIGQIVTYPGNASTFVYSGSVGNINAGPDSKVEIYGGEIREGLYTGGSAKIMGGGNRRDWNRWFSHNDGW